jgi:hypothetical protein
MGSYLLIERGGIMNYYDVCLPIAGHAYLEVQANSEEEAIQSAFEIVELKHIKDWDPLEQFVIGNCCRCPSPWEAEATLKDEETEGEE